MNNSEYCYHLKDLKNKEIPELLLLIMKFKQLIFLNKFHKIKDPSNNCQSSSKRKVHIQLIRIKCTATLTKDSLKSLH